MSLGPEPLVLAGIGLLAGVVASLMGLGGGLLMTPFLAALGMPMTLAVPTSTGAIAGTALLTGAMNWRQGNRGEWRIALPITLAMLPVLEASTWANHWLRTLPPRLADGLIGGLFIALMAWGLWAMMRPGGGTAPADTWPGPSLRLSDGRRCSFLRLGLGGTVAGTMGGLLGIGGGRVLVPLFNGPLGLALKSAIATSSLCILLSSCYSAASFGAKGLIDGHATLWLLAGSLPGAFLGCLGLRRVDTARLRRTFAMLTVAAMASMALSQFGFRALGLGLLLASCAWVGVVAVHSIFRPSPATAEA